jgi:hypothetical protein
VAGGDRVRGRLKGLLLRALLVIASVEIPSCLGGAYLARQGFFYTLPSDEHVASYLTHGRDPEVGWLPSLPLDASGARPLPAFPDPLAPVCVTVYGDSFAWSDEVDDEHAWPNVLARRAGCRVTGYGVPAYGTDQAYLRYLQNGTDRAPVALLGILSENVTRNINQYRRLLSLRSEFGLKPRFLLGEDGELRLVPIPGKDEAEVRAIIARPEDHLPYDYFIPGGPSGTSRLQFPYSASLIGLFRDYRIRSFLGGRAYYEDFYDPGHPSKAVPLTAKIAESFQREAKKRGVHPGVVVIPLVQDLVSHRRSGKWTYEPLTRELDRLGVTYLDAGPPIEAALAGKNPCTIYTRCARGHFNEEGYRLFGEAVHAWLRGRGELR